MESFWKNLPQPFFVLAPMADVTDAAFRMIITKYSKYGGADIYDTQGKFTRHSAKRVGGPDVTWTEFVSADGLSSPGREALKIDLMYTEAERPIVAQLFSSNPEKMREAAKLCAELGFDGIDINMGCPDRSIEKQGAGAAMIKNPEKAAAVIQAAKDGIKDAGKDIPVSVKTRVGYNKVQIEEWIPFLLEQDIAALTIHARTRKEMSNVPARWEHVKEAVEIRNKMKVKTLIIGNGDALNIEHARKLAEDTDCDGVMLGRAIFGNPWLFKGLAKQKEENQSRVGAAGERVKRSDFPLSVQPASVKEKLEVMCEHTKLFEDLLGKYKNFAIMKKHYKAYVNGFDGAKELRMKLMEAENAEEVRKMVEHFLASNPLE